MTKTVALGFNTRSDTTKEPTAANTDTSMMNDDDDDDDCGCCMKSATQPHEMETERPTDQPIERSTDRYCYMQCTMH